MPRRKRKVSGKHSLEFEESPFSIAKNVPSPVFCSDHPLTADVVNCDGVNIPWVSPQFPRGSLHSTRPVRRSRRVKPTIHGNNTTVVTPNHKTRRKVNTNTVPLRFVGERTPAPPSPIQDVTWDDTDLDIQLQVQAQGQTEKDGRRGEGQTGCDDCERAQRSMSDSSYHQPVLTTKTGRKLRKLPKKPPKVKIKLDDLFTSDSDLSLLEGVQTRHQPTAGKAEGTMLAKQNVNLSRNVQNQNWSSDNSSDHVTPENGNNNSFHGDVLAKEDSSHKLVNISQSNNGSVGCHKKPSEFQTSQSASSPTLDHRSLLNHNDSSDTSSINVTPRSHRSSHITRPSPNITTLGILSNSHCHGKRQPGYGSFQTVDKRRRSLRLLLLPGTPRSHDCQVTSHKVLVYDTPEEDYGMPVRERRLKYRDQGQHLIYMTNKPCDIK